MLSTDLLERQLLDALPATIRMLDLDGRLTSLHSDARPDDAETRVTHPSDHVGKPVWEVADAAVSREQVEHAMRHLRAGRSPVVRWEVATTTTDGDRVILTQMTPLHDESHAVTGFVIAATDISSSTLARDSALDAALTLARTVDLDRVYQDAALELRRMLRPDLVLIAVSDDDTSAPRVVYDTSAEGDRPALEQRFAATWRAAIERTQVVTSRTEVATEITAPMNGLAGALGAITIVSDDMTSPERVAESERYLALVAAHTAAAVERARDVDRASRHQRIVAIGEVAAGVAHELRNPIFGISSAAQLLRFRSREDPVMEKNVGRILREVERLNRMATELLEFGRSS